MKKVLGIVLLLMLLWVYPLWADTIYLKDGRLIKGTIIEQESYAIKVKVGNDYLQIYRHNIDKIVTAEEEKKMLDAFLKGPEEPSTKKNELVLRLFDVMGVKTDVRRILDRLMNEAPITMREDLEHHLSADELIKRLIPIYEKYYSEAELDELIHFYSSATGAKLIKLSPLIMDETMRTVSDYFRANIDVKTPPGK